ncbi:hypothetical protein DKG71_00570 [Streptomyces sp. NEAU-S7GS2]|nr:hypothetical protein DKG71_00570 [Streptomyces sp. NEAU-S7GS2]
MLHEVVSVAAVLVDTDPDVGSSMWLCSRTTWPVTWCTARSCSWVKASTVGRACSNQVDSAPTTHRQLVVAWQRGGEGTKPGLDHDSELFADGSAVETGMASEGLHGVRAAAEARQRREYLIRVRDARRLRLLVGACGEHVRPSHLWVMAGWTGCGRSLLPLELSPLGGVAGLSGPGASTLVWG